MTKRVTIGERFDSIEVVIEEKTATAPADTVQAATVQYEAMVRSRIAYITLAVMMAFIIGAALSGIVDGNFGKLQAVWAVLGPASAGILGYYFSDPRGKT